jgi:hypothetical protein
VLAVVSKLVHFNEGDPRHMPIHDCARKQSVAKNQGEVGDRSEVDEVLDLSAISYISDLLPTHNSAFLHETPRISGSALHCRIALDFLAESGGTLLGILRRLLAGDAPAQPPLSPFVSSLSTLSQFAIGGDQPVNDPLSLIYKSANQFSDFTGNCKSFRVHGTRADGRNVTLLVEDA